ncbi:transposase [Paenibacillus sp. MB22_1]|uniref:transposase n=1 Tax=Paenibacillus sp. MB22_1 TaxID=3383121 RepID=UPI00399EF9CD
MLGRLRDSDPQPAKSGKNAPKLTWKPIIRESSPSQPSQQPETIFENRLFQEQLIKKAGTNPIVKQTGGGKGSYRKISKQGNDHLRYAVYLAGKSLCMHNKDLKPFYDRLKEKGKHERAIFVAMGNKMLKVAFAMLRDRLPFQSQCSDYHILDEVNKKLNFNCVMPTLAAA